MDNDYLTLDLINEVHAHYYGYELSMLEALLHVYGRLGIGLDSHFYWPTNRMENIMQVWEELKWE